MIYIFQTLLENMEYNNIISLLYTINDMVMKVNIHCLHKLLRQTRSKI